MGAKNGNEKLKGRGGGGKNTKGQRSAIGTANNLVAQIGWLNFATVKVDLIEWKAPGLLLEIVSFVVFWL